MLFITNNSKLHCQAVFHITVFIKNGALKSEVLEKRNREKCKYKTGRMENVNTENASASSQ